MFSIIWLKHGAEITREPCGLNNGDEVVRYARAKAVMGLPALGHVPDEFRIIDEKTGHEIARQHIMDQPNA